MERDQVDQTSTIAEARVTCRGMEYIDPVAPESVPGARPAHRSPLEPSDGAKAVDPEGSIQPSMAAATDRTRPRRLGHPTDQAFHLFIDPLGLALCGREMAGHHPSGRWVGGTSMTNRGRWESEFDEQAYQDCRACMDACAYLDDMGRPSATLTPADIPVRVPPGWVAGPGSMAEPEESGADWAFHGD